MIKLLKILSEIKILGKLNPDEVHKLWMDLVFKEVQSQDKFLNSIRNRYTRNAYMGSEEWINTMNPKTLSSFYKDLLQIKQKYNIQEIQIHGAPSSDDIYALYSQILILINNNNDWGIRWNKKRELSNLLNTKYSRSTNTQFKDWVKTLPRSKLNSLLGDLLKFRDSIK